MLTRFPPILMAHKQGYSHCKHYILVDSVFNSWLPAQLNYNPLTENDEAIGFACSDYGVTVLIQRKWTNASDDTVALDLGAQIGRYTFNATLKSWQ
jgi:hypothetical protein